MQKQIQAGTPYVLTYREGYYSEAREALKWRRLEERHNCQFVGKTRETVDGIVWCRATAA